MGAHEAVSLTCWPPSVQEMYFMAKEIQNSNFWSLMNNKKDYTEIINNLIIMLKTHTPDRNQWVAHKRILKTFYMCQILCRSTETITSACPMPEVNLNTLECSNWKKSLSSVNCFLCTNPTPTKMFRSVLLLSHSYKHLRNYLILWKLTCFFIKQ